MNGFYNLSSHGETNENSLNIQNQPQKELLPPPPEDHDEEHSATSWMFKSKLNFK